MKLWQSEFCFLILLTVKNDVTPLKLEKPEGILGITTSNYNQNENTPDINTTLKDVKSLRKMLIPAYMRLQASKLIPVSKELSFTRSETTEQSASNASEVTSNDQDITTPFSETTVTIDKYSGMPELHGVQHAALPLGVEVRPLPLEGADHELQLNVTWLPSFGPPASDYSLEVRSVTDTVDCMTPMCYEYNIPGESRWWVVPPQPSPVAEGCAVRPGCAYAVKLIAHPWDGHTSANINVELEECVAGVCSCAHSPRLPIPQVSAHTVSIHGEIFVNVTWSLPPPLYPYRLPPDLKKMYYFVSIGKQMVSDAHPSPWFAHAVSRRVDVDTLVSAPDGPRWMLLPTVERSDKRSGERSDLRNIVLDVKLLARVNLIDERGCVGPAGNATAYDPLEAKKITMATYALWAIFGGTCVLAMVILFAVSARLVKRVLSEFRSPPVPVSASLEPLRHHPTWLPLTVGAHNSRKTRFNIFARMGWLALCNTTTTPKTGVE